MGVLEVRSYTGAKCTWGMQLLWSLPPPSFFTLFLFLSFSVLSSIVYVVIPTAAFVLLVIELLVAGIWLCVCFFLAVAVREGCEETETKTSRARRVRRDAYIYI